MISKRTHLSLFCQHLGNEAFPKGLQVLNTRDCPRFRKDVHVHVFKYYSPLNKAPLRSPDLHHLQFERYEHPPLSKNEVLVFLFRV